MKTLTRTKIEKKYRDGVEIIKLDYVDFDISSGISTYQNQETKKTIKMSSDFYNRLSELSKNLNIDYDNIFIETNKTLTVATWMFEKIKKQLYYEN